MIHAQMDCKETFIQVILPLKLDWEPYYRVPDGQSVQVGDRVRLAFAGRPYVAVVSKVDVKLQDDMNPAAVKAFHYCDETLPRIEESELALWRAVAGYYLCTVGEVYKVAYPPLRGDNAATRLKEEAYVPMGEPPALSEAEKQLAGRIEQRTKEDVTASKAHKPMLLHAANAEVILEHLSRVWSEMPDKAQADKPGNILWLVPEISLTKALEKSLRKSIGSRLILWTSTLTPARKRAAIRAVRNSEGYVVVGTRSAVFLPHKKLSLIMVQDEHDASYKQLSPAPRYNGRDTAVMLAGIMQCPVILSSASPSLESLYNCRIGRYIPIESQQERNCEIEVIDSNAEHRKRGMIGNLPVKVIHHCKETHCIPSFYKPRRAMFPKLEEIEPQLRAEFGDGICISEDLNVQPIPEDCSCLVIYGLDSMLGRNDFRADEKALQLILGTAGSISASSRPKIFIITRESDHSVFAAINSGTEALLEERKAFSFPPYSRLVDLKISDSFPDRAARMCKELEKSIRQLGLCTVMPGVDGLRLVFAKDRHLVTRKELLRSLISDFEKTHKYVSHISLDVDPL